MKIRRYSDAQIARMLRAAAALRDVMDDPDAGYLDFLFGKWAVLTDDVRRELETRARERAEMFVPPDAQLANFARWNRERGWGFTLEEFTAAAASVPAAPQAPETGATQLVARVLEIRLPDADGVPGHRRTFDELWDIAVRERGTRPCHLFGLGPAVRLELVSGDHAPGIRWRTIDFGHGWMKDARQARFRGTAPRSLPPGAERVDAGILAAAAHFPLWLRRMDGRHVPYVWLPGYDLPGMPHHLPMGRDRVIQHPCLTREGGEGRIFLYFHWDHVPFEDYAVPVYADGAAPASAAVDGDGFGG